MFFRKQVVLTRTLLQLTVATFYSVAAVGVAFAANSGIAPLLVPYTVQTIAGTPQFVGTTTSVAIGYFGEGVPATTSLANKTGAAVMNNPFAMAVDSVGNVYITDTANFIIREVNAQTGVINTIAGVTPKGCTGATCTLRTSGCADGVPAVGAPIGNKVEGIAVDAYGNVYFDDVTTASVSVIYRGGTQVANFIKLENPGGVANSGGVVQPGYVYHVAGTVSGMNTSSCSGTQGNVDNVLAFQSGQLHGPALLTLDSAGNIYVADVLNSTVRVINTQATAQTFFQYSVQPGFIRSITNCNAALTVPCPTFPTTSTLNTGINGPVNALVYNSQYKEAETDAYGNIYQLNGTGGGTGPPGIYAAAAYAGGAPLTNLLTAEAPALAGTYGPNSSTPGNTPPELPLTYGNSYIAINNPTVSSPLLSIFPDVLPALNGAFDIRPSSLLPDNFGTFWFMDNHYPELNRIDQYTSLATLILASKRATGNIAPINTSPASFSNPYYCVYGSTSSRIAFTGGPQTYDPQGDGCPAVVAFFTGGNFNTVSDGLANIYVGDPGEQLERELVNGNIFPPTAVATATPITQAIQVHFNSNNPPQIGGAVPDGPATGNTTTAFSIAPGTSDFTIDVTTPEFPLGSLVGGGAYGNTTTTANFQLWSGLPTCTQFGLYPTPTTVTDYDCLVYVKFTPQAPGVRQSQLVVTTANKSVYNFQLYGIGTGGQLAIDGGAATPIAATGLGTTAGIAISPAGDLYIADPTNNRIVKEPAGGTQSNLTFTGVTPTTLSGPMGVALDSANNVYISDTGNNRVLQVNQATGIATVLGNNVWIPGDPTSAPPQYAFKKPQGLAVDKWNNVYVADTGNAAVVEITSNIALGGAVALLNYPGAPQFSNPVGVAVDSLGNIYVADPNAAGGAIVVLPPGGGDLATVPTAVFPKVVGAGLNSPSGVAVDAAGNVYVSDSSTNSVIEIPSGSGASAVPFALNFPGVNAPGGLALDANGNLYVADTGNKQILYNNRQNSVINFGNVPQSLSTAAQPLCSNTVFADGFNVGTTGGGCPLTVTNIGNAAITLTTPFTAVSGATNAAFGLSNTCTGALPAGATCTILPTFTPTINNGQTENVKVNGGSQTLALTADGAQPEANVVLSAAYSTGTTPTTGATATVTATVTQPHILGNTPTGSVTFTYTINTKNKNVNNCGAGGTQTVALNGTGTASFQLPTLAQGLQYTVNANYTGDTLNSATPATPLLVIVPGIPVTATVTSTAAQLTFIYGGAPPVITGTVTPTPASPVTYSFGSAANATTPVGNYNVDVSFSGTGACAYGLPASVFSSGGPAIVTENKAPLTYAIPNFSAQYGAPDITYGANAVVTGAVNGETKSHFSGTFSPISSSILDVRAYSVVPTVVANDIGNYTVTAAPSTLTITKAPTGIGISPTVTQVLATTATFTGITTAGSTSVTSVSSTAGLLIGELLSGSTIANGTKINAIGTGTLTLSTAATGSTPTTPIGTVTTITGGVPAAGLSISVGTTVPSGKGVPSGSVTVTDNFTPITATGYGQAAAPTTLVVPLTVGVGSFLPNQTTPGSPAGIHQYSFAYSGDSNFLASQVVPSVTGPTCIPSAVTSNCLVVDFPDFTLTSTTGPVVVIPGVVPSGNGLLAAPNQSTAAPETAVLFVNAVLGFTGTVNLTCQTQNPSYVSCFMTPTTVCFATTSTPACTNTASTAATVVAIQTPATLPLGFKTSQVRMSTSKTVLAFLPFGFLAFCVRRRRRLSRALWMLIAFTAIGAVMSGCGGNQVNFYTPIPTGPQTVTVTASYLGNGSTQPAATRQFVVPIAID